MLISRQDTGQLLDFAIRYTCVKIRVSEFGIIEHDVLLHGIERVNPEIHNLLTDFLTCYEAWYQFHEEIDRQGKQGQLNADETRQLMCLSDRKDAARRFLTDRLMTERPVVAAN